MLDKIQQYVFKRNIWAYKKVKDFKNLKDSENQGV